MLSLLGRYIRKPSDKGCRYFVADGILCAMAINCINDVTGSALQEDLVKPLATWYSVGKSISLLDA